MIYRKNKAGFIKRIFLNPKLLALLGIIVIILISFPLAKNISRRHKVNEEIKQLEREISEIENKNSDLESFIKYLESDQFAEEQARLKLGFKKEGEEVAVVKEGEGGQRAGKENNDLKNIFSIPGLERSEAPKTDSNPGRWWRYFFK